MLVNSELLISEIKVFGDNIEATAIRIERVLQQNSRIKPHTRSAFAERLTGGYYLDFTLDRDKIALYGLTVDGVQKILSIAVGGMTSTLILVLIVFPAVYSYWRGWRLK